MGELRNLTVKGQVTVPRDVRRVLGLKAGEPVEFDWNAAGEMVIRKGSIELAELQRRRLAMRQRLAFVSEKYKHLATGRDTDDYMTELRDPLPTPSLEDV